MPNIKTVMTRREVPGIEREQFTAHPKGESPVVVETLPPWQMIFIRGGRVYVQSLIGFLGAAGFGLDGGLLPNDFLPLLQRAALLALAPSVMSLLQNTGEILAKLDITRPEWRA